LRHNVERMSSLYRAWRTLRSRSRAAQRQLVQQALQRVRAEGLGAALRWARARADPPHQVEAYRGWCARHTPDAAALAAVRAASAQWRHQPTISILTPAYDTTPQWLDAAADSVLAQAYERWEWCVVDDGSGDARSTEALARLATRDPRIRVYRAPERGGVSAASNLALARASGEFVALLDHDDVLAPHALASVVALLNAGEPPFDAVYSDEDKLDEDGVRCDPYFKPDWSPDLFRSSMYACHLLVLRRALVEEVGGFRTAFDFSQDYDLLLRVIERTTRIAHVPDVLYHWRKTPASTARAGTAKPTAHQAGARALQAHLDRQAIAGRVLDAGPPGLYRVRYHIEGQPGVSVVVPTRDAASPALAAWLEGLVVLTDWRPLEIVVASDSGAVPTVAADDVRVRGVTARDPFNYSAWVNQAASVATEPYLLMLHDDVSPQHPEWLAAMLELATRPWVGMVGAKLFDAAGALQHIGLVRGLGGVAGRPFAGHARDTVGYFSNAICIRNCSAVSGACVMTPKAVFDHVGGLDERLSGVSADVDYALRVSEIGRLVVITPYARLTQAQTGGVSGVPLDDDDWQRLRERWGPQLATDPFYSPHLSRHALDYRIA
jgi:O-antigen biosynthesis protein